jgi:hypothetical protein
VKKKLIYATAMLIVCGGLVGTTATGQIITEAQCLTDAKNRFNATLRECDRLPNFLDRLNCRLKAFNDYLVDRQLCVDGNRPEKPDRPGAAPVVKPPSKGPI